MNGVAYIGPFEEYHTFILFNLFLWAERSRMNIDHVVAIIPEKALGSVSEADEIVSISNEYLDAHKGNYPYILEKVDGGQEGRNITDFHKKAIEFCKQKYPNHQIIKYNRFTLTNEHGQAVKSSFNTPSLEEAYIRDVNLIRQRLNREIMLYPSENEYLDTMMKYGHLFPPDKKTYIIMTRHFQHKVASTNTIANNPELLEFIPWLSQHVNVLNIGFPPAPIMDDTESYKAIQPENLNHHGLMSLFLMADGVMVSGENGAMWLHYCSCGNQSLFSSEWTMWHPKMQYSLIDIREKNTSFMTNKIFEEIKSHEYEKALNKLLTMDRKKNFPFSREIPVHFVDKQ